MGWQDRRAHCGYSPPTLPLKKGNRSQRKPPLRLRVLPAVGRRKEIGENLRYLPEISRLGESPKD
jgi:hypothetical protein